VEFRLFSPDAEGVYSSELPYALPQGQSKPKSGKHGIAGELRVPGHRALRKGEDLSFFYPSTEWDSAKPFDCLCGSKKCFGSIQGAKYLSREELDAYYVNPHIQELVHERDNK
jgi:hypothetical protein